MPARKTGRELLSSRLTNTLLVVPMVAWVVLAYVLLMLMLQHVLDLQTLSGGGLHPLLARLVLFFLLAPLLALPGISWWAAGLRRVETDGAALLITLSTGRVVPVPLAAVHDISERINADLRVVTVDFDRTAAGRRRVRFLAPTRFPAPKGEPHPVVTALRDMVRAAKSEREMHPAAAG